MAVGPLVYEGNVEVYFIPENAGWGIADINVPTTTELGGGVPLSSYIPKNGISFNRSQNMIDTSSIDEEDSAEYPGGRSGTPSITFKLQNRDGLKAAYELFRGSNKQAGDLIFAMEGSIAAAAVVDVYRVVSGSPIRNNPAAGEEQRFSVSFGVQKIAEGVVVAGA